VDPTLFAFALGLGSAVTLAGANTFVKAAKDILGARAVMALTSAILIAPAAFFDAPAQPADLDDPRPVAARALALPDRAGARPVARRSLAGLPGHARIAPLLTAVAASLVLGEHLSPLAILGLDDRQPRDDRCFALPEKDFGGSRKVRNSALLWAVATGACVAIYNVIDAQGVRSGPSQWSFIVWLFLLDWIGINTIAFITRGRRQFMTSARAALWPGLGAGVCSLASFSMALYGFSIAPVAYMSAMRETAVVFGALMGWWFLREGFGVRRTFAAILLAGGLSLLQFG
jgi:drug/metabolite transporter (DMT)-like permease